ncbi:HAD-IIB family hydrolase [Companilactobacillus insicii]|uniref:HAD-IIB family hydrolase n=1 Tax=Companilactobacillus insicii TaxID=1732567 RepID=UPI0013DDA8CB|nr:HAD-IIB family hydrolase [Companilactobacillus insicii]
MKNFVFDIDGTVSFDGQSIPDNIVNSIKKIILNDNQVIFASARPIRDLLPVLPEEFSDNLLIGANGAMVSNQSEIRIINSIGKKDAEYIFELITRYQLSYVVDSDWNYASQISESNCMYGQIDVGNFARRVPLSMIESPVKVILLDLTDELIEEISGLLNANTNLSVVSHIGEGNLNITASEVNKYSTLNKLGITEYIAFGNDMNDIEMLQHAESGIWITSKTDPLVDNQTVCAADVNEIIKNIEMFL